MRYRLGTLLVLALAGACTLAVASTAAAKTTHSTLRVEGPQRPLDAGNDYSNVGVTTRNTNACGDRDSRRERLRGANAMGLIGHAARANKRLNPFRTSDTFDFGLVVCRIGDFKGFENTAWLYRVDHEFQSVGADQRKVGRGDEVLWYLANFANGSNTGDELELRGVPVAARPGQSFGVRAVAYDDSGNASPAGGVSVRGATAPTGPDGTTTVTTRRNPGTMNVRGTRATDIASRPLEICVQQNLSRCPDARGERYFGTARGDKILAGAGPDVVAPRRGADVVKSRRGEDLVRVRGGGHDFVNCGKDRDVVIADRGDDVRGNCEVVRRGG